MGTWEVTYFLVASVFFGGRVEAYTFPTGTTTVDNNYFTTNNLTGQSLLIPSGAIVNWEATAGTVSSTTVIAGGTLNIKNGGILTNNAVFSASGTMTIEKGDCRRCWPRPRYN